ncbi:hypothetical protein B6U91_00005, partial [Candidatus Pacearchaeota archaeon ex4484_71]
MKYLLGSPKDFHDFIDSIPKEGKVGILTHTDVDGIVSGIFLKKILKSRGISSSFVEFLQYGSGVLEEFSKRRNYDFLILTDWNADNFPEGLGMLREKGKVLVVDHHPINDLLEKKEGIIKTDSTYCSSHALFDLANEGNYFDTKNFELLVCSAIIMDYTFGDKKVFEFLREIYPKISKEEIFESVPGKIGKEIDNALIYYRDDLKRVFDIVYERNFDSLEKVAGIVEIEIENKIKEYKREAEYFPTKGLYFYFFNPTFSITSPVINKVSHSDPEKIFILAS